MKPVSFFLAVLLLSAGLAAQTSAQSTAPATPPDHHQHMMAMQEHMQEMNAQIAKMQANVEAMKSNAAQIKDPAMRRQADLDTQMWQMMVDHMHGMQKMMAEHGGRMGHPMRHVHHPERPGTPPPPPATQPQ